MNTSLITTCTLAVASGLAMAERPTLTTSGQTLDRPIYVGDRGVDLCGVDVYTGNASCDTITTTGVSCGTSTATAINSVARPLAGFPGGAVACVDLGFETVTAGAGVGMIVELYQDDDGIPNTAGMTLLGSTVTDVPDGDNQIVRVTFDTPVECPAGNLVVVATYAGTGGLLYHAGDAATDGAETYILAADCAINDYASMSSIGFAGSDWTVCVSLAGDFDPCDFPLGGCPEDINGDLLVNVIDLLAVISNYGSTGDGSFRPEGDVAPAPNGDCTVNTIDLLASVSALGADCTPRGGCCLGDDVGTCEGNLSADDCAALGGTYQGTDTVCADISCPVPSDNDECATAEAISGDSVSVPFETSTATPSSPEPSEDQCPNTYLEWGGSADVWFAWTPGGDGQAIITTCDAASYDTSLVVYEGDCETQIACNGDSDGGTGCQAYYSEVSIAANAGTTYYIRLGGWQGATGAGTLTIINQSQEPGACCLDSFTCLDQFEPATCSDAGGVYQGSDTYCANVSCDTTPRGACCLGADDCLDDQSTDECASAGGAWLGEGTLCDLSTCFEPVTNDECANAVVVYDGPNAFANLGATTSSEIYGETNGDGSDCTGTYLGEMSGDVWFSYTAGSDGNVSVTTCDAASFDTDLVIYSGACSNLTQIACNGDSGETGCQAYSSATSFEADAGSSYIIRVGGWDGSAEGTGTLTISGPGAVGVCCADGACSEGTSSECDALGGTWAPGGSCADTDCPQPLVCNGDGGEYGAIATGATADNGPNYQRAQLVSMNSITAVSCLAIEYAYDPASGFTGGCDEDMDFNVYIYGDAGGLPDSSNVLFSGAFDEDSVGTGNLFGAGAEVSEYSFDLGTTVSIPQGVAWVVVQGGADVAEGSELDTGGCWFLINDVDGGTNFGAINDGTGWLADSYQLAYCVTGDGAAAVCGDGFCTGDEDYTTCPADCDEPGVCPPGQVEDCVSAGVCHTETWIGDGYCDGDLEEYGANLCCYETDGGDCTPEQCDGDDSNG